MKSVFGTQHGYLGWFELLRKGNIKLTLDPGANGNPELSGRSALLLRTVCVKSS